MKQRRHVRILLGKLGLDGHTVGLQLVSKGFRDAGFEVIYAGMLQRPSQLAAAAAQEDVDLVGISSLSGAHMVHIPRFLQHLRELGADMPVIVGGVIPLADQPALLEMGVAAVFGAGTPLEEIVTWVQSHVAARKEEADV